MDKSIQSKISEEMHTQIIAALPWYVNGTLAGDEYEHVKTHLVQCMTCTKEVETLKKLETAIQQQDIKTSWQPGQAHLQSIFNQIDQAEQTAQPANDETITIWQKICNGFDTLFDAPSAIRWTVAAQSALVVMLSIVIVMLMPNNNTATYFETYSTEKPLASTSKPQVRVVFSETMALKALTALLSEHSATIIDGPSPRGVITIQLNSNDADSSTILSTLRKSKYVEFAEIID